MSKNVAVFVDVANIFYAAKAAGVDIDYVTLLKSASAGRDLVRAYAYTGLDPENENQRNFHSFLARHGYRVVSKDIRKYGDGKVKANLDIELVVDMMKTARNLDIAIVVSGDGDFAPAIRAVQEMGVRVEVISFRGNTSSDLMDVADQFTDITALAKVEKGSSRSGRRVAGDDEDLSMTEVPDKQTEGTGAGRGRCRGRERTRSRDTEVAASRRGRETRTEPAVAVTSNGAPLVVLPGEKLSRAAADAPAAVNDEEEAVAAEGALEAFGANGETEDSGDRRRRRRRGGRGRGRGRGRGEGESGESGAPGEGDETPEAAPLDEEAVAATADRRGDDYVAAPRGPRTTPFGSVWDSQLGVPASLPSDRPAPVPEEEDFDEPEIPEYLIAEQRRNRGGRSQPGRGARGRSGYAAAVERERYGRGGGGGINRYPDVSGRERQPREAGYGRNDRSQRAPRPERPAPRSSGGDPWSEVPPEIEEMLRAQLATRPKGSPATAPAQAAEGPESPAPPDVPADAEARAPKRRTPRRRAAAEETPGGSGSQPEASAGQVSSDAEAAAPKRRTTRRSSKATEAEASADASAPATGAEAPAPKRRTRRTAAAQAEATATEATAAEEPAAAPKRRTTRRKAATEVTGD